MLSKLALGGLKNRFRDYAVLFPDWSLPALFSTCLWL